MKQYLIPGVGFINENMSNDFLIPGSIYVNESSASAYSYSCLVMMGVG